MAFCIPAVMSNNVPVLGLENLLISVYEPVSPSSSDARSLDLVPQRSPLIHSSALEEFRYQNQREEGLSGPGLDKRLY
jgi:hypothetical protein